MVGDDRPSSCTEGTLDEALDGGGLVTFNCHPADLPIVVTSQKVISANTQIDGGGLVTLSGGNTTHIFGVNVGLSLALNDITLGDGNVGGCDGGDIYNTGTLAITSSTLSGNSACLASQDQLGVSRPQGPACDFGAVELGRPCQPPRRDHVLPDDGDLLTCVSRYTGVNRWVRSHSQCLAMEVANTIPATP